VPMLAAFPASLGLKKVYRGPTRTLQTFQTFRPFLALPIAGACVRVRARVKSLCKWSATSVMAHVGLVVSWVSYCGRSRIASSAKV